MKNFYRAVKMTFPYRWSILSALACALLIGVLWGGNITVIYPVVEIALKGGNLQQWTKQTAGEIQDKKLKIQSDLQSSECSEEQKKFLQNDLLALEKKEQYINQAHGVIEHYAPTTPFATILLLVVFIMTMTLLKGILTVVHSLIVARICGRSIMELRNLVFQKALMLDPNSANRTGISDVMSRMTNDVGALSGGIGVLFGKMVREPIKMFACLILAAYVSWQLLLVTLLMLPVVAFTVRWIALSIKRTVQKSLEQSVEIFARLDESLRSLRTVRCFQTEKYELKKFEKTNEKAYHLGMKVTKYGSLTNPLTEFLGLAMICISLGVGGYLVLATPEQLAALPIPMKPLSLPSLLLFFGLLAGAADPARKLSDIFTQFQSATAAADRVYELLDRPTQVREPENPMPMPANWQSMQIENVTFEYEREKTILHDVSLNIAFGETIVVVGQSGCGKSTLMSLIARFADPNIGSVKLGGIPIKDYKLYDLYQQIGWVPQEPVLINSTVRENILYGTFDATEEQVVEAAKLANAHRFIVEELADGYDTSVGPGGNLLSGGQRQRIALARALLKNPNILLLDEATSQIDIGSERLIYQALRKVIGTRTTIIVTHRVEALTLADRVVVMNEGRIEHIGTHAELLKGSTYYAEMFQTERIAG